MDAGIHDPGAAQLSTGHLKRKQAAPQPDGKARAALHPDRGHLTPQGFLHSAGWPICIRGSGAQGCFGGCAGYRCPVPRRRHARVNPRSPDCSTSCSLAKITFEATAHPAAFPAPTLADAEYLKP